jgi:hypothetical protein
MTKWIRDIFQAGAVNKGALVRRSKSDVLKNGGYRALLKEVKRRKFHLIRTGLRDRTVNNIIAEAKSCFGDHPKRNLIS